MRFRMDHIWKASTIPTTFPNLLVISILILQQMSASLAQAVKISNERSTSFVPEAIQLSKAAKMLSYMNESIDPCNDFYEFSCGNWPKIYPARPTESTGLFENLAKALDEKIAGILKAKADPQDTEIDKKVKNFYESCTQFSKLYMDENVTIQNEKLVEIMNEFGGMPALRGTNWNATSFDWIETVAKIANKYNTGIILKANIMPDFTENTINRVYIQYPNFPLMSRAMYVENSTWFLRNIWKMKITLKLKKYLGMEPKLAKKTSNEIVEFEAALAYGMVDQTKNLQFGELSERTTIAELQAKYAPYLDVEKLIRISFGEDVLEPIYEFASDYQVNLIKVINATPKTTIANYIMYTLVAQFILNDAKTPAEHEKKCITKTKEYFAKYLDNMVYRSYNLKALEKEVNIIWNDLRHTLKMELLSNKLHWITQNVRQLTIEKLDAMRLALNTYENENFAKEFVEININRDDFISNIRSVYEFNGRRKVGMLHERAKPAEDGVIFSFMPVNIIEENIVKLPIALIQPFYLLAENYPSALKYGGLGAIMAHELIHGFDDSGRKYDKQGNQIEWWDEFSIKEFKSRKTCFIDQYSNFTYTAGKLPRSESQSENIADNGGVRIAYLSYLRWLQHANVGQQELETFSTMKYTNKQLFFISYAQIWCNDIDSYMRIMLLNIDTHMPGKFRVLGPLSNFPEFAKEFNCPKDTVMNPTKKCEIY